MASRSHEVTKPSPILAQRLVSVVEFILFVAIAAASLIILQKSFHFIDTTPFLNVDDSIPNVAVTLAEHGRYGFLSSPTQGLYDVDRTHAFFNYGPLYFYVAAALTWLVGPSLKLYRMLHPTGLVWIVLASLWVFRRVSIVGTALLAVMIFNVYLISQWPLARPDIMVSVCAAGMLIFAARAISQGGRLNWFGVGFFAVSAVTTHQIAAAMIPVSGVIWVWSSIVRRRDAGAGFLRGLGVSLAALTMGGLAGTLVYLFAIDFRLHDLWVLGTAGMKVHGMPYAEAVQAHFDYAWASLPQFWRRVLEASFGAALLLAIGGSFLTEPTRRRVTSLVMPPVVAALFYQVSLGFYGNQHTGYAILSQVTTCWAIAAMFAAVVASVRDWAGPLGRVFESAVLAGMVLTLANSELTWLRTPSNWEIRAPGNVDISDYVQQVVAPLPERASVWGSLFFGLDAGDRTDLVQYTQVWKVLLDDFGVSRRAELAPDFLLLGSYELDTDSIRSIAGYDTTIENFGKLLPTVKYRLVHLVYAPPFGVTREYERIQESQRDDVTPVPGIAVNDGTNRQWNGALSAPLDVKTLSAEPVTANLSIYSLTPERAALSSARVDLPAGFYLIDVELERPDPSLAGFILATPGEYFYWRGGWTDFSMPAVPYLPGDKNAWVLVDHLGGPLYLSRYENPPAVAHASGIKITSVRRVAVLADKTGRIEPVTLPGWSEWQSREAGVSSHLDEKGNLQLKGTADPDAWLIQSPPIMVPQHERLALSLPTEPSSGGVEVGVMDSRGPWLASPTLMPRRVVFDTGTATQVTIVIANSHLGRAKPLDVSIQAGKMVPTKPESEYVDTIMGCRSPYIRLSKPDCLKK